MRIRWGKLLISLAGCLLIGITGGIFTSSAIPTWYITLNKPFFNPPNWVFGPVWTTLYLMMGLALYLVWTGKDVKKQKSAAIQTFSIQLALNFLWSFGFFGLRSPYLGLIIILMLLAAIVYTMRHFYPLSKTAAYLMIPYLCWVTFATILNTAIVLLN